MSSINELCQMRPPDGYENMQYAYAFLDQYISEHNTDFNEQELVELIKKYVVVNGQHPDHIQKAIENKVSILHGAFPFTCW